MEERFCLSIKNNDIDEFMSLLKSNPELINCSVINETVDSGTPLMFSIRHGRQSMFEHLIKYGADVNIRCMIGGLLFDTITICISSCFSDIIDTKLCIYFIEEILKNGYNNEHLTMVDYVIEGMRPHLDPELTKFLKKNFILNNFDDIDNKESLKSIKRKKMKHIIKLQNTSQDVQLHNSTSCNIS